MLKKLLKIVLWAVAALGVVAGALYWREIQKPEYVEIYNDHDDDLF